MANEITERSCLEAELLLGYRLFTQQEKLQSKKEALQKEATALKAYETARERNLYNPTYQQSVYNAYWKYREAEIKKKQEAEKAKKETEARENVALYKRKLIVGVIVISCILLAGIFLTVLAYNSSDWSFMFAPLFFLIILPLLIYVPVTISQLLEYRKQKITKSTVSSWDVLKNTVIDFPTYAKRYYGVAKMVEEYDRQQADFLAKQKEIVEKANGQIALCDKALQALDGIYGGAVKKLAVVPAYYFKPEAVEKMLFFYVNKRADNVRDLINLYETTVFQEAVLRSLKDIAVSVDRLTEAVRGGFVRLGTQLGVLNESICENTKMQRISGEKLAQIQDENARHYLEIVDAIGEVEFVSNTYVTTEITIE